ncbi:GxxExxY protein [Pedobacter frigiditerrae]|uniref:GxxExxY protein n=1 Tax=Pedobacter frigiditerrae TaxID=2530452 RepID=A0A4R0MXT6_9SPHI|nr:GxxExxY protein [Pedobacter frigiditerrae]TCC92075.1 GxxExxY protein [Pedobacter frigiditerrae]
MTKAYLTDLIYKVNGAAIEIHKALGPGLLESVYHKCMIRELQLRNIDFKSELSIPINYKGLNIDVDLRCDLLIKNSLIVEFKSVEKVLPIHIAQLMTYMKLLKLPIGLMINFNCTHIFKEGQKTYVNELYEDIY